MATGLVQKNSNQLPGSEFALILAMLKIGSLVKELPGGKYMPGNMLLSLVSLHPAGSAVDPLNDVLADPLM